MNQIVSIQNKARLLLIVTVLLLALVVCGDAAHAQTATLRVVANFFTTNGAGPSAGLTLGADGNFYGTTEYGGGTSNFGTVFKVTTNGQLTSLVSFVGTNGAYPYGGLTLGSDGSFYGTTVGDGASDGGTIFKVTTNGQLTTLFSFRGTNGSHPLAALTLGADGNFYGTTYAGGIGTDHIGTVFKVTTNGQLTSLVAFVGTNGAYPYAGLTLGADGSFYGTTSGGGASDYGTVFRVTPNGQFTSLVSLPLMNAYPEAALTLGGDGTFYGTTPDNGIQFGTVFKVTTNGQFTSLVTFEGTNGASPYAPLALGPDGNFYGTTYYGGTSSPYGGILGYGTVFRVTTDGELTSLAVFGGTNGAKPHAGLALGPDGNFYGTTSSGGISGAGVIFALQMTTAPEIVMQPQDRTNNAGTLATFSVSAAGAGPLSYQWRKGGTNLTDAGNLWGSAGPTLTISNVQSADAGGYDVVITNSFGSVTSAVATLTVVYPPTIVTQPQSLTNGLGTVAAFSVGATGDSPLSYQWRKSSVAIGDATNSSYSIASTQAADSGSYDVVVSNPYGSATSQVAVLIINIPGFAWRTLHASFEPGEIVTAQLDITPPPGTTNWTLYDYFPFNWSVVSATNSSLTNDLTGLLEFGSFTKDQPQTLTYQVASIFELVAPANFSGYVVFNGVTNLVGGNTNVPAVKNWEFVGPSVLPAVPVTGVAYGAGRWVATSTWGWSTTLADGGHWTYPKAIGPFPDNWSRMVFVGGKFLWHGILSIDGDPYGQIATSPDGVSWKTARDPSGFPLFGKGSQVDSIAYGTNGVYVAVGSVVTNGMRLATMWTSTDGYQWAQDSLLPLPQRDLHAVAYGGGQFIAVGDYGTVSSSVDGSNWITTQDPLGLGASNTLTNSGHLVGIGFGPAGWLIIGNLGPSTVMRSTNNGASWFLQSAANPPGGLSLTYYHTFYADGLYWFASTIDSYSTSDGTSWIRIPYGAVRRAPDGVVPRFLAGGNRGNIYGSSDATNWTQLAANPVGSWLNFGTVLPSGNNWLLGGVGCSTFDVFSPPLDAFVIHKGWVPWLDSEDFFSDTNLNWSVGAETLPVLGDGFHRNGLRLIAGAASAAIQNGSPLLVVGQIGASDHSFQGIYLPTNSQGCAYTAYDPHIPPPNQGNWAYVNASFSSSPAGLELYAEAASFVPGSSQVNWGHYLSIDGTNWTLRAPGLNDHTAFPGIRGIAWGGGKYVAVATGTAPGVPNSTNRIFTSTDGQLYTAQGPSAVTPQLGSEGLTGVGFNAGSFIAVGNQGRILYSTNGTSWQSAYASDGTGWNRLRYLNNTWWAVGNVGRVASSTDGIHWAVKSTGVRNNLNDIATQQGYYMVAGKDGMVLRSTFRTSQVLAIVAGSLVRLPNGAFQFMVQMDPNVLPTVEASDDLVTWSVISPSHTVPDTTGLVALTDNDAATHPWRFYRARLP